jgi:hypothetical protein
MRWLRVEIEQPLFSMLSKNAAIILWSIMPKSNFVELYILLDFHEIQKRVNGLAIRFNRVYTGAALVWQVHLEIIVNKPEKRFVFNDYHMPVTSGSMSLNAAQSIPEDFTKFSGSI